MLPSNLRYWLFDQMSVKTMRYVSAVADRKAEGLTKQVYTMIREDLFRNGSLTSRSKVPELNADHFGVGRTTLYVEFGDFDAKFRRWWLVVQNGDVDVCMKDPGPHVVEEKYLQT